MNSISVDIKNVLVTGGYGIFGASTGWSINISTEPKSPDSTITIYDTGGALDYTLNRNVNPVQRTTFQVRIRNKSYLLAYAKILSISKYLEKLANFTTGNVSYCIIQRTSDIFSLGMDDNKRYLLTANFQAARHESE